jgi:hypothetical protein
VPAIFKVCEKDIACGLPKSGHGANDKRDHRNSHSACIKPHFGF